MASQQSADESAGMLQVMEAVKPIRLMGCSCSHHDLQKGSQQSCNQMGWFEVEQGCAWQLMAVHALW